MREAPKLNFPEHRLLAQTGVFTLIIALFALPAFAQRKAPADTLSGPPFVSAKAWGIADGKTGDLLWSENVDTKSKSASTTKMMCAFTILQLAKKDPGVLNEIVTFSKSADATTGSTSGIREGESIPVRDCLFALMLPSGNDAGNALAEHFSPRLKPPTNKSDNDSAEYRGAPVAPRANFIAEMNRVAASLGMTNTIYRSPFGDGGTENDRTTTVRDLLTLASNAMREPLFREIVSTTKHHYAVSTLEGGKRTIVWENTNQLLKIEGYDGIKTGTTTQAGACLVSSGKHKGDWLLCAVLGSALSDGRYIDSRNLFRWAWTVRATN